MIQHSSNNPNKDQDIKLGFHLLIIIGLLKTFSLGFFQIQNKLSGKFWGWDIPLQDFGMIRHFF